LVVVAVAVALAVVLVVGGGGGEWLVVAVVWRKCDKFIYLP
jgi:hypothetical protein